jgi:hypothetical protein
MAISRPSGCVPFVGSSPRDTESVAWSAASRSNPLKRFAVARSATTGFVHLNSESLERPDICRRFEPSGQTQYAANEQSCSALRIGMRQTHQGSIPKKGPRRTVNQIGTLGSADNLERRINMLWTIFVVLGILWLLGFSLHIGGGLIHLLLVIALVVLVINLLSGRRGVA